MRSFFLAFSLILLYSLSSCQLTKLHFLEGRWQIENTEKYEVWERSENGTLVGYGYMLKDGQKIVLENLAIKKVGSQIVYQATVADQNDGATISFLLKAQSSKNLFSFENEKHDFPKKIQYKKVAPDKIEIKVVGDPGKVFSYQMLKK